ncbi:Ig-like domain-containing protein [Christiangramia crocea]|uniref:Ig-like domain-containing protein n=1 Tax=Christiangramia crocea TaxID=2904124 RepID=A0A9X1UU09_9FLAO|nr:Ig-like domain-containing protein [Gramella crocea]MCG9970280.1 Ig-like domain-containing protein [Gramella crocea]
MISAAEICYSKGFPLRKACAFLFLFFTVTLSFSQQPSYTWADGTDLEFINVRFSDLLNFEAKSDRLIIAIETNPAGEVYFLTYGNGIKHIDSNGNIEDFISGDRLTAPMDFSINSQGEFYVANNAPLERQIIVYSSTGVYLPGKTIGNGEYGIGPDRFKGPMSVAFDSEDNLYVADHYTGDNEEATDKSHVKIYYTDGNFVEFDNVEGAAINFPYRIAADNQGKIYLADLGSGNGRLQVIGIDKNSDPYMPYSEGIISSSNLGSPGDIVVDSNGYVHVADFGNDINLTAILGAADDPSQLVDAFDIIKNGIQQNKFDIDVFAPDRTYKFSITEEIDLAIDLALDSCDSFYVNNFILSGTKGTAWLFYADMNANLDFDLEIYKRSPSNDNVEPIAQCVGNFDLVLVDGSASISVPDINNGSSDNCGIANINLSQTTFTETGVYDIIMTVTDNAGNQDTCPVQITVTGGEEPTLDIACLENKEIQLIDDQPVTVFAEDLVNSDTSGLSFSPASFEFNCSDIGTQNISVNATDDETGATDSCVVAITVKDVAEPIISNCPDDRTIPLVEGETYVVPNFKSEATFSDNCYTGLSYSQVPAAGNEINESTPVTIRVTDDSGLFDECTFQITIERQQPPVAECNDFEIVLDENGNANLTAEQVYSGDNEDLQLDIDRDSFNCSNLGENSVQLTVTDPNTGLTDTCTSTITVIDSTAPVFTDCPASNTTISLNEGETYTVPDYSTQLNYVDNCDSELTYSQIPSPDTEISETTAVMITVTDDAGLESQCSFDIIIERVEEFSIQCVENYTAELGYNINTVEIPTADMIVGDTSGIEFDIEIQQFSCADIGEKSIIINATKTETGETASCTVDVNVVDKGRPLIVCPAEAQYREIASSGVFVLPEVVGLGGIADNCSPDEDLVIVQDPPAGTEFTEEGDYSIDVSATDPYGNEETCTVVYSLSRANSLSLNCPGDYEVFADENCQYFVPDFSDIVQVSPPGATIEQSIEPGSTTITNADPFITITATYEDQVESCDIYLLLKDEIDPSINCIADQTVTINEGETYTLPDYRSQLQVSDNCKNYQVVQDPAAGTEITQDTEVAFTVTDQAGNMDTCSFQLNLITEGALAIGCPPDKIVSHEACPYSVPDYTDEAEVVNGDGAEVTQNPSPGSVINGSEYEVTLRVEKNGEFAECSFLVTVVDDTAPEAICVENYEISLNEGETVTLAPSQIDDGSTDSCSAVNLSLDKTEFTSADEGANTVTLTVTDEAGNVSSCEATVQVTVTNIDVNQPPVAYDEEYTTEINTSLNVPASNGVLVNDTDPENDELTAVLDTDVENGTLQLNADGSFTYTPDTDFVGQDFFTYKANDGEYDSNTIFVSINVVDSSGEFGCTSQVVLGLGTEGEASLDIGLLYHGNAEGIVLSADQLLFDCDDIGENTVTLTYTGRLDGTCEIPVMVVDDAPPVLQLRDISIDLNLQGVATISFEDINNGSYDECDVDVTYTLSKMVFSCKDLGENIIQVTAEDESGNTATASAIVRVFAEKEICTDPLPGPEYIFIYPNPNSGSFKVATPGDVTIQRIEVFDKRGRFITARNYATTDTEYAMHLVPLQEAVYILKLVTNEGIYIKRMIFKR